MYDKKAVLSHLPSVWMVESSMRKLCPAKSWYGSPTACRAFLTIDTKYDFVNGVPFVRRKKGPSVAPLAIM